MLLQLAPTFVAGALLTGAALNSDHAPILIPYLPGLWSLIFALGVFACRPYLPRATFGLGCYYLVTAGTLFAFAPASLQPWAMGFTFGIGQLLAAGIVYRDIECRGI
jgi:hypothetical protein